MADYAGMKLGKRAPRHDIRTLQMADYLRTAALPAIPPTQDWGGKITDWTMMANDRIGDCTCAAAGHLTQEWTFNVSPGSEVVLPDSAIIDAYSAITGYGSRYPAGGFGPGHRLTNLCASGLCSVEDGDTLEGT